MEQQSIIIVAICLLGLVITNIYFIVKTEIYRNSSNYWFNKWNKECIENNRICEQINDAGSLYELKLEINKQTEENERNL